MASFNYDISENEALQAQNLERDLPETLSRHGAFVMSSSAYDIGLHEAELCIGHLKPREPFYVTTYVKVHLDRDFESFWEIRHSLMAIGPPVRNEYDQYDSPEPTKLCEVFVRQYARKDVTCLNTRKINIPKGNDEKPFRLGKTKYYHTMKYVIGDMALLDRMRRTGKHATIGHLYRYMWNYYPDEVQFEGLDFAQSAIQDKWPEEAITWLNRYRAIRDQVKSHKDEGRTVRVQFWAQTPDHDLVSDEWLDFEDFADEEKDEPVLENMFTNQPYKFQKNQDVVKPASRLLPRIPYQRAFPDLEAAMTFIGLSILIQEENELALIHNIAEGLL